MSSDTPFATDTQELSTLRMLVVIASYGLAQDRFMERLVQEYRNMSIHSRIVVLSNIEKAVPEGVELVVGLPTSDPWSLPFGHKQIMADHLDEYDLFVYSENDVLLTENHFRAFLETCAILPADEIPGFLLFERSPKGFQHCVSIHGHFHWDSRSVCKRGSETFAFLTNEHSACFVLTRRQLQAAIQSGGFLVPPHKGKYDLLCTASTDPYTSCGLRRLICVSRLHDFLVHHLPDKYTGPEITEAHHEFAKQVRKVMELGQNETRPEPLFETETKLPGAAFSKSFYEPLRSEVQHYFGADVSRVLSIGCGMGKTERWLVDRGTEVTAIPVDPIIGATLEGTGIKVSPACLENAFQSLQGEHFDCAYLSNILHLVPDPQSLLERVSNFVRPGGTILIVSPNTVSLRVMVKHWRGEPGYRDLGSYEKTGVHDFSVRKLAHWLKAASFEVSSKRWIGSPKVQPLIRLNSSLFGRLFGTEVILSAKKKE